MNYKQKFEPSVFKQITQNINELSREELNTRYWKIYDELTTIPETSQSLYMQKEFKYIYDRLQLI